MIHYDPVKSGDADGGRPRRKKDTKRWCRGKTGIEHQGVLIKKSWTPPGTSKEWSCKPAVIADRWLCFHEEVCSNCGKILKFRGEVECPDRPEVPS